MISDSKYRIAFVIPYFGKFPKNFRLWLKGCACNTVIDFLIFTDDHTSYDYPSNVHVKYMAFEELKDRIQKMYDFGIIIDRPWRISLFKPAYGEIFEEELQSYDFWGYCDVDVMWGDIRAFITDEILEKYDRIGTKGHAQLYKNNPEVNARYKHIVSDTANYISVFNGTIQYSFDENGMDEIYDSLNIPYYFKPNFAHLEKYESGFYIKRLPKEKLYTNKYQIFLWENGKLFRICIDNDKLVKTEYMYIHFFCRPMRYITGDANCNRYIIYPDIAKPCTEDITLPYVKKHGSQGKIVFLIKMIYHNRKKFSFAKIINNIGYFFQYRVSHKQYRDSSLS